MRAIPWHSETSLSRKVSPSFYGFVRGAIVAFRHLGAKASTSACLCDRFGAAARSPYRHASILRRLREKAGSLCEAFVSVFAVS